MRRCRRSGCLAGVGVRGGGGSEHRLRTIVGPHGASQTGSYFFEEISNNKLLKCSFTFLLLPKVWKEFSVGGGNNVRHRWERREGEFEIGF